MQCFFSAVFTQNDIFCTTNMAWQLQNSVICQVHWTGNFPHLNLVSLFSPIRQAPETDEILPPKLLEFDVEIKMCGQKTSSQLLDSIPSFLGYGDGKLGQEQNKVRFCVLSMPHATTELVSSFFSAILQTKGIGNFFCFGIVTYAYCVFPQLSLEVFTHRRQKRKCPIWNVIIGFNVITQHSQNIKDCDVPTSISKEKPSVYFSVVCILCLVKWP